MWGEHPACTPRARAAPWRTAPPGPRPEECLCPARRARSRPLLLGQRTVSSYIQTPGLRPRAALPRLRAAPAEPAQGGAATGPDGRRDRHPRPTADRPQQQRRQQQSAAPSPPPARRQQQRSSSSSPGQQRRQRQSSPTPSSSSSVSTPAELPLQLIRRAPVHPRAAALRPQSSRLDRQPAIFRVRRLPDGDEGRPCIRTDSEGGCHSSVRLGPQVRVRREREVKGTRATGSVTSITPSGSGRR